MKNTTMEAITNWLKDNAEERLEICQNINSYDGSMDFCEVWDIEELAETMSTYEMARAIIYGNVTNVVDTVRFNGYGNLETVDEYDLEKDGENYIGEIIDFIDSYGFSNLNCDELEELYNELEEIEE